MAATTRRLSTEALGPTDALPGAACGTTEEEPVANTAAAAKDVNLDTHQPRRVMGFPANTFPIFPTSPGLLTGQGALMGLRARAVLARVLISGSPAPSTIDQPGSHPGRSHRRDHADTGPSVTVFTRIACSTSAGTSSRRVTLPGGQQHRSQDVL